MVCESTVLVESQDKKSLIPLRRVANRFIYAFDELLALINGGSGMERLIAAALGIDPSELRQLAGSSVGIELLERLQDSAQYI